MLLGHFKAQQAHRLMVDLFSLPALVIESMTCLRATHRQVGWHHSGFPAYCWPTIWPGDETGMENPARSDEVWSQVPDYGYWAD
jgi:hypothetical protein